MDTSRIHFCCATMGTLKTVTWEDLCTTVFTAALVTIANTWKQPKWPLTDEWIKMWYINVHNGILLSHIKEWNNAICSNMNGPRYYHIEQSKSKRERQIPYDIIYMWNLKYDTRSSRHGAAETNPTRNHEVACLIPALAQWVKDLALPWAVV